MESSSSKTHSIPIHYKRAAHKTLIIINKCDIILEIADARILRSSSNLFNYDNNVYLKNKPRMIIINFLDRANLDLVKEWLNYFKEKNIYVCENDFFKVNTSKTIIKKLVNLGFVNHNYLHNDNNLKPIKIAIVSLPNVRREKVIQDINKKYKSRNNLWSIFNYNRHIYYLNSQLEVDDTPPVVGCQFEQSESYFNLQILDKINLGPIQTGSLALNAFAQIAKLNPELIFNRFGINISSASLTGKNSNQIVLEAFNKIAIKSNLKNEFNNISKSKAFSLFINEVRNGKLGPFCLEKYINKNS